VNGSVIRRPPFTLDGVSGFRSQVKVRLVDPTTWTGLIYLVVQFPIGIVAFVTLVAVYATAGAMVISPLGVMFTGENHFWDIVIQIQLIGTWNIDLNEYPGSLLSIPFGIIGFILASHLVLTYSSLHGWWAKLMLGSRSSRVSSRPVTSPTGDDPPRPSTSAESSEIVVTEPDTPVTNEDPNSGSDVADTGDPAPETKPESDRESPETAALTPFTPVPTPTGDPPILRPVPNPSDPQPTAETQPVATPNTAAIKELTTREGEVFLLMAHGDTNADIAEELFISEGTVKTHVKRILSKLYMRDRTQVVVFAYEHYLVVPGSAVVGSIVTDRRSFGG